MIADLALTLVLVGTSACTVPEDSCGKGVDKGNVYQITLLEEQPLDLTRASCSAIDQLAPSSTFKIQVTNEFAASSPICATSMGKFVEPPNGLSEHNYAGRSNGFNGGRSERPAILVNENVKTGPGQNCSARWQTSVFFGGNALADASMVQAIRRELIPDPGQAGCKYCFDDWVVTIKQVQ
ncbi:MAG: hypothetical protein KA712_00445 [Myxococcales bacterium]|nr:hypothetical protein [Myxococcales bacterium]